MKNNFHKLIIGLLLLVVSIAGYVTYQERTTAVVVDKAWDDILIVTVQDDCSLDITLSDGKRIHAFLEQDIPPKAKKHLIVFFNNVEKPKCHLVKKIESGWLVEIQAKENNEDVSLIDNLDQNHSIWD